MVRRIAVGLALTVAVLGLLATMSFVYGFYQRGVNDELHQRAARVVAALSAAEFRYATQNPSAGFTCSLDELQRNGQLRDVDVTETRHAYQYVLAGCQSSAGETTRNDRIQIIASPIRQQRIPLYTLCSDETGVVRYTLGPVVVCSRDASRTGLGK